PRRGSLTGTARGRRRSPQQPCVTGTPLPASGRGRGRGSRPTHPWLSAGRAGAEAVSGEYEGAGGRPAWVWDGRGAMRVLVIGGTGLISTGIVKALLARGHAVTVFNRGKRKSRLPDGVTYLQGDRKDYPAFEAAMQDVECDAVIDMIAFVPEDTLSAIRAFRGRVRHFIHCSTVCTYGVTLTP